jgi:hypothetical protein
MNASFKLARVAAELDRMDPPLGEAESRARFTALMVRVDRQRRRREHARHIFRAVSAVLAAATGAGAYRLLTL